MISVLSWLIFKNCEFIHSVILFIQFGTSFFNMLYWNINENVFFPLNLMAINRSLQSATSGKEVLLSHKKDLSAVLKYTREHLSQNDAFLLSRAAQIHLTDMSRKKQNFSGVNILAKTDYSFPLRARQEYYFFPK